MVDVIAKKRPRVVTVVPKASHTCLQYIDVRLVLLTVCILIFTGTSAYVLHVAQSKAVDITHSRRKAFTHPSETDLLDVAFKHASGDSKFEADQKKKAAHQETKHADAEKQEPVLVSYAYHEKDGVQKANAEYFIIMGMGLDSTTEAPANTEFIMAVSGQACEPCNALLKDVKVEQAEEDAPYDEYKQSDFLTVIWRFENSGMDMASHNVSLQWALDVKRLARYAYFIFINSSARGPFVPSYMPIGWRWPDAFTRFLNDEVKGVSVAITCLPEVDAGGPGPRMESWAFALDKVGLQAVIAAGAFNWRTCKLCNDGVVVGGEYGISKAILDKNYNIATLLAKYAPGTDWRDKTTWNCNNNVHPSRHGSYEGVDMHPFETLFVKSSWHVGEPFTTSYSRWFMYRALGRSTTDGKLDIERYRFFISTEAMEKPDMSACYPLLKKGLGLRNRKAAGKIH